MNLNYKKFGEGFPLIILHGLLGSLDNWQTIAKKLADPAVVSQPSTLDVYIVDQRNHGKSPHTNDFNYDILSADLLEFMQQQQIQQAHLLGHSMGGKTVMKFALQYPEKVAKLIVADVAPVVYEDRHSDVFAALFAADVAKATSRDEIEKVLRQKLDGDETTVQFLMKGLHRAEGYTKGFEWKFNLEVLYKHYADISEGITADKHFTGPALFIKGQRSSYVTGNNYPVIEQLFPNNQLAEIKGAGHWLHAEKPADFLQEVVAFISQ
ncbi:MAG TPA: alpha/beta fold hydrolase [Chitinophagales bacterium]|nr:alpha/beta fold hydrolase [Chitinophagales bacterium]